MNRLRVPLLLVGLVLLFAGGLLYLFNLRQGAGDVYPIYSSERADPLGTRLLHDSLAQVPGLQVERSAEPLSKLRPLPERCILVAGLDVRAWNQLDAETVNALDAAVRAGSRLIITMKPFNGVGKKLDDPGSYRSPRELEEAEEDNKTEKPKDAAAKEPKVGKDEGAKPAVPPKSDTGPRNGGTATKPKPKDEGRELIRRLWGIEPRAKDFLWKDRQAFPTSLVSGYGLQPMDWLSCLYFHTAPGAGWEVVYNRSIMPVLVERRHGRGSIVIAGESHFITNEALNESPNAVLLSWLVGDKQGVVFEENHLGVQKEKGVAMLARRYGLAPACGVFLLLAVLYFWKTGSSLVPIPEEQTELALDFHPTAGLVALLRRSVPKDELIKVCETEWRKTARPSETIRLGTLPAGAPAAAYNEALRRLRKTERGH